MNKFFMHQARQLQERLAKAQQELAEITVEATSGGGAVKVVINGQQKVQSVKISPEVVSPDDVQESSFSRRTRNWRTRGSQASGCRRAHGGG